MTVSTCYIRTTYTLIIVKQPGMLLNPSRIFLFVCFFVTNGMMPSRAGCSEIALLTQNLAWLAVRLESRLACCVRLTLTECSLRHPRTTVGRACQILFPAARSRICALKKKKKMKNPPTLLLKADYGVFRRVRRQKPETETTVMDVTSQCIGLA